MQQAKILLVDDDPGMIQLMGRILSGIGRLRFATTGAAALQQAAENKPDLILLDAEMPGVNGFDVCERLQADPELSHIPVIFVSSHGDTAFELKGLSLGAVDFITKPISEPLLTARVRTQLRIKALSDELRRIATIDALTECINRRSFDASLDREWKRCLRFGAPISLLMIDVDHFKHFNDYYGHPAGDACLRSVAQALRGTSRRPADSLARYGGEEFAMLLPDTPRAGALMLAERALDAIASLGIPHEASTSAKTVTVSIGVSYYDAQCRYWLNADGNTHGETNRERRPVFGAQDLVKSADRALYVAKSQGRARLSQLEIGEIDQIDSAKWIAA